MLLFLFCSIVCLFLSHFISLCLLFDWLIECVPVSLFVFFLVLFCFSYLLLLYVFLFVFGSRVFLFLSHFISLCCRRKWGCGHFSVRPILSLLTHDSSFAGHRFHSAFPPCFCNHFSKRPTFDTWFFTSATSTLFHFLVCFFSSHNSSKTQQESLDLFLPPRFPITLDM